RYLQSFPTRRSSDLRSTLEKNLELSEYHFNWQVDTSRTRTLQFKGYEAERMVSEITGLPRLKYDRESPLVRETPYRDQFKPKDTVSVPEAYIIGQSHTGVMERLDANKIRYYKLDRDTTLKVEAYKIVDYATRNAPYEGHYLHYGTQVDKSLREIGFRAGDFVVPTAQPDLKSVV